MLIFLLKKKQQHVYISQIVLLALSCFNCLFPVYASALHSCCSGECCASRPVLPPARESNADIELQNHNN